MRKGDERRRRRTVRARTIVFLPRIFFVLSLSCLGASLSRRRGRAARTREADEKALWGLA